MHSKTTNILEFLGAQNDNVTRSILNLGTNVGYMFELDEIFSYPLSRHSIDASGEILISSLYLDAHKGYCLAIINFLRLNKSTSMMIMRKAIEHTLSAYHLCKFPDDAKIYLDRDHEKYGEIFWNIKKFVSDNQKEYPLAAMLPKMHDIASKFASHSTAEAHLINLRHEKDEKGKSKEIKLDYIEPLELGTEFEPWYFGLLKTFLVCYEIFWKEYFEKKFKVYDEEFNKRQAKFARDIEIMIKKYPLKKIVPAA